MKNIISTYSKMNKSDLKKLSKSQLIKMLLKQENKPIEKPKRKQMAKYNLDDLFNDDIFQENRFARSMKKVTRTKKQIDDVSSDINIKYQNLISNQMVKNTREIREYPMIQALLDKYRKEELKVSSNKNKANMNFVKLFKERLSKMEGDKEPVSIVIKVSISDAVSVQNKETKKYGPYIYSR